MGRGGRRQISYLDSEADNDQMSDSGLWFHRMLEGTRGMAHIVGVHVKLPRIHKGCSSAGIYLTVRYVWRKVALRRDTRVGKD